MWYDDKHIINTIDQENEKKNRLTISSDKIKILIFSRSVPLYSSIVKNKTKL